MDGLCAGVCVWVVWSRDGQLLSGGRRGPEDVHLLHRGRHLAQKHTVRLYTVTL